MAQRHQELGICFVRDQPCLVCQGDRRGILAAKAKLCTTLASLPSCSLVLRPASLVQWSSDTYKIIYSASERETTQWPDQSLTQKPLLDSLQAMEKIPTTEEKTGTDCHLTSVVWDIPVGF